MDPVILWKIDELVGRTGVRLIDFAVSSQPGEAIYLLPKESDEIYCVDMNGNLQTYRIPVRLWASEIALDGMGYLYLNDCKEAKIHVFDNRVSFVKTIVCNRSPAQHLAGLVGGGVLGVTAQSSSTRYTVEVYPAQGSINWIWEAPFSPTFPEGINWFWAIDVGTGILALEHSTELRIHHLTYDGGYLTTSRLWTFVNRIQKSFNINPNYACAGVKPVRASVLFISTVFSGPTPGTIAFPFCPYDQRKPYIVVYGDGDEPRAYDNPTRGFSASAPPRSSPQAAFQCALFGPDKIVAVKPDTLAVYDAPDWHAGFPLAELLARG